MLYTRTYIHREPKVSERARSSRCRRKGAEATEAYLDQITKTRRKNSFKKIVKLTGQTYACNIRQILSIKQ